MKTLINIIKRKAAGLSSKLAAIQAAPSKVCMGYAFGVFLAATPFVGLKVILALPFVFLFKWSKVATIIGIFHVNILNGAFFYGAAFVVGKYVLGMHDLCPLPEQITLKAMYGFLTGNISVFLALLAGGVVLGIPMAVAAWFIARTILKKSARLAGKHLVSWPAGGRNLAVYHDR